MLPHVTSNQSTATSMFNSNRQRRQRSDVYTPSLSLTILARKISLQCQKQFHPPSNSSWPESECVHFLGKYPGHGSNLYGYLWAGADSISANITNNSPRLREKVSKWLISPCHARSSMRESFQHLPITACQRPNVSRTKNLSALTF